LKRDSERIPRSLLPGENFPSLAGVASEPQKINFFLAWNPAMAGPHLGAGSFNDYQAKKLEKCQAVSAASKVFCLIS
jgi:hypothetical protein